VASVRSGAGSTSFKGLLKDYLSRHPLRHLLLDGAGKSALLSAIGIAILAIWKPKIAVRIMDVFVPQTLQISAGILGLVLGSLAIIASFSDERYLLFLQKRNVHAAIMLQFVWTSIITIIGMLFFAISSIVESLPKTSPAMPWMAVGYISLAVWTVGSAFLCIHALVRYCLLRIKYIETAAKLSEPSELGAQPEKNRVPDH
jgi:hypothetical protein